MRPNLASTSSLLRAIVLTCCVALPALASAAAPAGVPVRSPTPTASGLDRRLTGAGLVADVDLLERTYTALHPGLYRYATPRQVRIRFAALRRELSGGATLGEAYLAFARFAATVRCGHTYPNFYNQPEATRAALLGGAHRLPFHFRWLDGRMVVVDAFGVPGMARGAQVLRVGGVPVQDMLAALMRVARADGGNDGKRIAQMQVLGSDEIEAFDVYLPLLYPQFGQRPLVMWRNPDGALVSRRLQGLNHAQRRAQSKDAGTRAKDAPAWTLDTSDPALAVLRMPGWALYDSQWDWRGFLDASFARLIAARTPALVIDLRGNEGGIGVGEVLLQRLATQPIALPPESARVRYHSVPAALRPALSTWDKSFFDWGDDARPLGGGWYHLARWQPQDGQARIEPVAPRYAGRVFALVGADNSSATFEFSREARASSLATLVGQTTGGNRRGINGGAFLFLTLPHSGIELDVPLVATFPRDSMPDAGIEPDVRVTPSVRDISEGRDAELTAVRALLAR